MRHQELKTIWKWFHLLIKELWNHPNHLRCVSGCQCRSLTENTVCFTGISHSNKITNFHEQRLKVLAGPHTHRIRTECEKRSHTAQIYFWMCCSLGRKKKTDSVCLHTLSSGGSAGLSHALAWDWASSVIVTRLHSALSGAERGREVAEKQKSVRRNTWACRPELNMASPTCFTSFQPSYWQKTYHTIHQTHPLSFSPDSGLKIDLTDTETVDEFHTPLALTCLHWNGIKPDLIRNLE